MTSPRDAAPRRPPTLISSDDLYLWNEGAHLRAWDMLGAHPLPGGTHFAVWAPNARQVSVIGDFNGWRPYAAPLDPQGSSGIFAGFVPGVAPGALYKYHIVSQMGGAALEKADPVGFRQEEPPRTASVVWDLAYEWGDQAWMEARGAASRQDAPLSIYELHLGSWRRPHDGRRHYTYTELAEQLVPYVTAQGFTHVEFLPVMEHPFYGSWGYQVTGYFSPTARYGSPQDLMALIDALHQAGVGVILDWVPSHFPDDPHGLAHFDGTHLYEHADPRLGVHPDWHSLIFNYGRREVQSFLLSSGLFWLDRYHADGLRVDAVASMLYLDYSRRPGEWIPNRVGGRENLEAIDLLRRFNRAAYARYPGIQTYAEESTAWPQVSRPTDWGGLGFGYKWDMGWMHDTLQYFSRDPIHRRHHHHELTFRSVYAQTENFVLPLSHDEVVHGKGSLVHRMPGDRWQKLANLRLLLAWQFTTPGKPLLFMGDEWGQWREWDHEGELDWDLLGDPAHVGIQRLVHDLNGLERAEPALFIHGTDAAGFRWVVSDARAESVYAFWRLGSEPADTLLVAVNATPVPRPGYHLAVPAPGRWREVLNTDAGVYGGGNLGNLGGAEARPVNSHADLEVMLPPLAAVIFKREPSRDRTVGRAPDQPDAVPTP